jgi:DNA-binding transcriptional regulator PaaX
MAHQGLYQGHFEGFRGLGLDYNQLKLAILQVLSEKGQADGYALAKKLQESKKIVLDIHALRMALMRYYKQGLLKRERQGGLFTYALSERGAQRLRWLEQQAHTKGMDE